MGIPARAVPDDVDSDAFREVTESGVQRRVANKRKRRGGRPRDLTVLDGSNTSTRRSWRARLARWRIVPRLPLTIAAFAVLLSTVGKPFGGMVKLIIVALAALVMAWLTWSSLRAQWTDPLVLVARVTGGVDGIVITGGKAPSKSSRANDACCCARATAWPWTS
jgi:hypothetical protein